MAKNNSLKGPLVVLAGALGLMLLSKKSAASPASPMTPGVPSLPGSSLPSPGAPPVVTAPAVPVPSGASPSTAALFQSTRLLKEVSPMLQGADVQAWQTVLSSTGFPVDVDGIFGPQTAAATRAWQGRYGITADGIVGQETRARAAALLGTPAVSGAGRFHFFSV
jgi:peptidoglycan hydrolase-like protein with peptidoglycan-binding domain